MKATGIIRRIDDLGRVVIPREIRRSMHFHEGDPLEIYTTDDGGVVFKKYQSHVAEDLDGYTEAIRETLQDNGADYDTQHEAIEMLTNLIRMLKTDYRD
jgi:stage V sporulation protein T